MTSVDGEIRYSTNGLAESTPVTAGADGEVHIVYEAFKCYSAWIEILTSGGIRLMKIPFLLTAISKSSTAFEPKIRVVSGDKIKVVASTPSFDSKLTYSLHYP